MKKHKASEICLVLFEARNPRRLVADFRLTSFRIGSSHGYSCHRMLNLPNKEIRKKDGDVCKINTKKEKGERGGGENQTKASSKILNK